MPFSRYAEYKRAMQIRGNIEYLQQELRGIGDAPVGAAAANFSDMEEDLARANTRLQAVVCYRQAQDADKEARAWTEVKAVLDPDGLRAEVFRKRATEFNHISERLAATAGPGWSEVKLNTNTWRMEVAGTEIVLCSRSEQWRAQATVATVVALMDKAIVCLIDDMDTLKGVQETGDTTQGMLKVIRKVSEGAGIPIVLAVASAGGGHPFWRHGGRGDGEGRASAMSKPTAIATRGKIEAVNENAETSLTKWEIQFMESITDQFERTARLSERQIEILDRIYCEKT